MTLDDYITSVLGTDGEDWTIITRPVYLQSASVSDTFEAGKPKRIVDFHEHDTLIILKGDLSISIAFGLTHRDDFREEWARKFPDPSASSQYIDLLWNGRPVCRLIQVSVDGARAILPLPRAGTRDVPRRQYEFFAMLDRVLGGGEFERYFAGAGLVIVEDPWP